MIRFKPIFDLSRVWRDTQYSYMWLPFQYHSIFVICVCRISAAILSMLSVF